MVAPKLRFKEFDENWVASRIDEIASVTSGGTPSRSNSEYWDGNIPWVTTSLVDFNVIQTAEEFITQDGLKNSSAKLFPKNTILMAMYGQGITRGKVAILGIEATTNQACCAIKLNNSFDTNFIFQNLMNRYEEIRDLSNDGGQKNLSAGIIKEIEVVSPSKAEQNKIASFLSAVDEKINHLTQKHQLLSQYKQGMMQKLFSQQLRFKADDGSEFREWKIGKLGDITSIQGGFAFKSTNFGKGMTKVIRIGDIEKNINLDSFTGIYSNEIPDTRYLISENAIVMALSGATFGKLGKVNQGYAYINQRVATFKVFKDSLNEFLYQIMLSQEFTTYIQSIPSASAQPNISNQDVINFEMMIPCLEEQTKIANFLSSIDQKIDVVSGQIEQAKLWKKGLLQQMFV